jgi:hypothetical protein
VNGSNGTSGTAGSSGTTGTSGSTGTSGTAGSSGSSGTSGTSGTTGTSGTSATDGTAGTSGTTGKDGNYGGDSLQWALTALSTAPTLPPLGGMYFNGANFAATTQISISLTDGNTGNATTWLQNLGASTNTIKGSIRIARTSQGNLYGDYQITGVTIGTFATLDVVYVASNGLASNVVASQLMVSFARAGDQGSSGTDGQSCVNYSYTGVNPVPNMIFYTDCGGNLISDTVNPGQTITICAISGTQSGPGSFTYNGLCSGSSGTSGTSGTTGTSGSSGTKGTSGTSGLSGNYGGDSLQWTLAAVSTAPTLPAAGEMYLNGSTFANTTQISVSLTDNLTGNATSWLTALGTSTNAIKGSIRIMKPFTAASLPYGDYQITSVTIGTFATLDVVAVAQNGSAASLVGTTTVITFARAGDKGTDGTSGTTGTSGTSGTSPSIIGYVPYTGATQAVNLGAFDLTVNSIIVGKGPGNASGNVALGWSPLNSNQVGGTFNLALGYQPLFSNTTGDSNVAVGAQALLANTTGTSNTATGVNALAQNIISNDNTANGDGALYANTGDSNTAVGRRALYNNITGNSNIGIGLDALLLSNTDSNSIVIGASTTGLGSNTVVIGNSSITTTRLRGAVKGGSFVKDTGTVYETLRADGSVTTDGTLYKATSISFQLVSGTSQFYSAVIPSNIFASGDNLKINTYTTTTVNSLAAVVTQYYINTTPSIVGATQIAQYSGNLGSVYYPMDRVYWVNGGNLYARNFTGSTSSSTNTGASIINSTAIPGGSFYIIIQITTTGTDLACLSSFQITKT